MMILMTLLLIVEVLSAFLLVVVILAQKSKDQGLGMAFGGGVGESLFGSRAGNVLTRITITLAIIFMVDTMVIGVLYAHGQGRRGGKTLTEQLEANAAAAAAESAVVPEAAVPTPEAVALPAGGGEEVEVPVSLPGAAGAQVLRMGEDGQLRPVSGEGEGGGGGAGVTVVPEEGAEGAAKGAKSGRKAIREKGGGEKEGAEGEEGGGAAGGPGGGAGVSAE